MNLETMREPMKKPMLQERTIQDAIAFWQQLRHGQFRPLFAEPTENTVTQLFRYVLTGASSFLVDFLLLFLLEMLGVHYGLFFRRGHHLQLPADEILRL